MGSAPGADVQTVYAVGSHDDFTSALGTMLTEVLESAPDGAMVHVKDVTQTTGLAADETHWSAVICVERER
jgi:hypothetical protein